MSNIPQGQYRTTQTDWQKVPPYVKYRYTRALSHLPTSGTVFELGAGIGVGTAFLALERPDIHFIGLEMSKEAVQYGKAKFGNIQNLELVVTSDLEEVSRLIGNSSHLLALEVLEHLNDDDIAFFKSNIMPNLKSCFFSFPYNQQNIEGTDHLQSFDIYSIFEIFPGFETIFLRRSSLKFIGYWCKKPRKFLTQPLGVAGESDAVKRISPCL